MTNRNLILIYEFVGQEMANKTGHKQKSTSLTEGHWFGCSWTRGWCAPLAKWGVAGGSVIRGSNQPLLVFFGERNRGKTGAAGGCSRQGRGWPYLRPSPAFLDAAKHSCRKIVLLLTQLALAKGHVCVSELSSCQTLPIGNCIKGPPYMTVNLGV